MYLLLILQIISPFGDMPPILLSLLDNTHLFLLHLLGAIEIFLLDVVTIQSCSLAGMVDQREGLLD